MNEDDDFFNEDFIMPEALIQDLRQAEKIANPIADENDYSGWQIEASQPKSNYSVNSSKVYSCENDLIHATSKIALKSLVSKPQPLESSSNNYLYLTCRMLTSNVQMLQIIELHKLSDEMNFCINVIQGFFVHDGFAVATDQQKKKKIESYKYIDRIGVVTRFLVEYAVTHSYIPSNHGINALFIQYCRHHFQSLNSNLCFTLHVIVNLCHISLDKVVLLVIAQDYKTQFQHLQLALNHNLLFAEQWLCAHGECFFSMLKNTIDYEEFEDCLSLILSQLGSLFVSGLIKHKVPFFNWFLEEKYIKLMSLFQGIQDLVFLSGNSELMMALFTNDESILKFVHLFEATTFGEDPIGFAR